MLAPRRFEGLRPVVEQVGFESCAAGVGEVGEEQRFVVLPGPVGALELGAPPFVGVD